MKVLHIINDLQAGGAQKLLTDIIHLMNEEDNCKVEVLFLVDKDKFFYKNLKDKNVKVSVLGSEKIRSLKNVFLIKKFIKEGKFDIVHSHLFPSNYYVSLASMLLNNTDIKFVTTEHNTYNRRRNKKYFKPIEKFIYSKYHKIISISKETESALINWLNFSKKKLEKFKIIENGINLNDFKNTDILNNDELMAIKSRKKVLCMVGSFTEQKDQKTIINALPMLPDDVVLWLVGDGPLKADIEAYVLELGVTERVKFLGRRSDINKILKIVDIVVLSSLWEGFGLAAVEGMAAGKPVIASNVPGLKGIVENAGLTFELQNYEDLAYKISLLLDNEIFYNKVTALCLERANSYSVDSMVKQYLEIYRTLI